MKSTFSAACVGMVWVLASLTVGPLPGVTAGPLLGTGVNGGASCAVCTFGVAMVEQLGELHNDSVVKVMDRLCFYLDQPYLRSMCQRFVSIVGPLLLKLVSAEASPDRVCHTLGLCTTDPGRPTCHSMLESQRHRSAVSMKTFKKRVSRDQRDILSLYAKTQLREGFSICDLPGIKAICQYIENAFSHLVPVKDSDHDFFGTAPTLRGSAWRGKDCDDTDPATHPGAIPINDDVTSDSNCNGIFGKNPKNGVSYERELCEGTQPRGVAVLGDSLSAHFHFPEAWLDPTRISLAAFKHVRFIVENEIGWPHLSSVTGLGFNNWTEVIQGPIDSIYLRLRERNRCNHKDYQNIGINGARSSTMADQFVQSLARNQSSDRPLVVFYALVGMDVCNQYADDTLAYMTTPSEMRNNVLKTLSYLDNRLPKNSTVFLMGLADGRVLFDSLKNRVHPIARYWNTFTYSHFYDFFNCLQITSCAGWLNTNATIRYLTAQRARELTVVLQDMAKRNQRSYKHFNVYYMDYPMKQVIDMWTSRGGQTWQLLEPVDGFHSNQYGQALVAQVTWEEAEKIVPGVFGPHNLNNHHIAQIFGDQGSYF